jgi:hypothetical protein
MANTITAKFHFFRDKITKFEFWPFWLFYFPMYFYGLYLALKSGSFMYFSTANPGMKYGGVMGESKFKVLSSIPVNYIPKTQLIKAPASISNILKIISKEAFSYPFIIKPNVGERGKDVELIHNEVELHEYLPGKSFDLIIQKYVPGGLELGIMYHRLPGSQKGVVTSVVQKGFLAVTGDGKKTLRQLMEGEIRAKGRLDYLLNKFKKDLDLVIPGSEKRSLEPIGNHCRGTTFFDATNLINDQLNEAINEISLQIEGFFYGRFDLKVPSLEDLYSGKNIKILELNGVSSEVAHVYDPDYKLTQAYRDIARHMKYIYQIARKNHALGVQYDSLKTFLLDLRDHLRKQ